jgi:integrase
VSTHRKGRKWVVRYRDGERNRSRSFDRKADAERFDVEVKRRRQLGGVASLEAGRETLDEFVVEVWARIQTVTLAPKTRTHYASLYDHHLSPYLGRVPLRELRADVIARWQAERLSAGAGPVAVRQALELLGAILQRAVEAERIAANPTRLVRRARRPRRQEVRPLSPATIEAIRASLGPRDATLVSVLAYAGLRPGEALALRWADVRERTLLVERALSQGREEDTKTRRHRTVRLLAPLKADLARWRLASRRPPEEALVFPARDGCPWSEAAYQSWRRRSFDRAANAASAEYATPYALRHSFASLLLHEGRSVIYVAQQLGHDARLTLTRYGHVIDELDEQPRLDAEAAIRAARVPSQFPDATSEPTGGTELEPHNPSNQAAPEEVELAGLEPATSWVRYRARKPDRGDLSSLGCSKFS